MDDEIDEFVGDFFCGDVIFMADTFHVGIPYVVYSHKIPNVAESNPATKKLYNLKKAGEILFPSIKFFYSQ